MKHNRTNETLLGITATARAVHAVLLQDGPEGPEIIRRFSRQRSRSAAGMTPSAAGAIPDMPADPSASGQDFTIQFGDTGGGGGNLFLASEFTGLEKEMADDVAGVAAPVATFELELRDLFDECRDAGYADPTVAFSLVSADTTFVEVRALERPKNGKIGPDYLKELLSQQYKGLFEEDRVAFLPMTPGEDGGQRFLAVFPKAVDPVTSTLRTMHAEKERMPVIRLLDAEVPLYVGLARLAQRQVAAEPPADDEDDAGPLDLDDAFGFGTLPGGRRGQVPPGQPMHTLVVRAGFEDTLVLFMQGEVVHHCESLRSLTAFDAPETICSRVLLQQDENGFGDVHHVLLLSEEREPDLIETFGMFFPDARVETLRDYMPQEDGTRAPQTAVVPAAAAALRLFYGPDNGMFESFNFLPKKLAGRQIHLPINWPMMAVSVLIVVTTLFFSFSYSTGSSEIEMYRTRLNHYTQGESASDIRSLQASIDSMQTLQQTYTRALQVLDTLLTGSDRWSRVLEKTSAEAAAVKGIWIESMVPSGNIIQLIGSATNRDRVVAFADRVGATIQTLTFSEVREWPVYNFSMRMEFSNDLPAAAKYLREQVELPEGVVDADTGRSTVNQ